MIIRIITRNFRFCTENNTEKQLQQNFFYLEIPSRNSQTLAASAIMAITTRLSFIMFGKEIGVGVTRKNRVRTTTNCP